MRIGEPCEDRDPVSPTATKKLIRELALRPSAWAFLCSCSNQTQAMWVLLHLLFKAEMAIKDY